MGSGYGAGAADASRQAQHRCADAPILGGCGGIGAHAFHSVTRSPCADSKTGNWRTCAPMRRFVCALRRLNWRRSAQSEQRQRVSSSLQLSLNWRGRIPLARFPAGGSELADVDLAVSAELAEQPEEPALARPPAECVGERRHGLKRLVGCGPIGLGSRDVDPALCGLVERLQYALALVARRDRCDDPSLDAVGDQRAILDAQRDSEPRRSRVHLLHLEDPAPVIEWPIASIAIKRVLGDAGP